MQRTTLILSSWKSLAVVAVIGSAALAHDGSEHGYDRAPADALAVTTLVRTGEGEHTYESVPEWCKLPEGRTVIGPTHGGVVEDKDGLIYFTMDAGPSAILVYNSDGTLNKQIGDESLCGIHGLTINTEGDEQFLYGAQIPKKRAVKLKLDGTIVSEIPFDEFKKSGKYDEAGSKFVPTGIAVAPDGTIFVADGYGSNWIHRFDKEGKYIDTFGGPGEAPGKFKTCHGVAIDKRDGTPKLIVCDRENRRLQYFDLDGKFLSVAATDLRRPCSISFHGDHAAVAELEARVTILDKDNKQVAHLGDNPDQTQWAKYGVPPEQWKPGIFTAPHGVAFTHDGNVYVLDWNASGRLSKFKQVDAETKQAANASTPEVASR